MNVSSKNCMSSTIHILQLGESRGKNPPNIPKESISIPQQRPIGLGVYKFVGVGTPNENNGKSEYSKEEPLKYFSSIYKINHISRIMSLLKSCSAFWKPQAWVYGWTIQQHFVVTRHCWKWSVCRAQENNPKKKWYRLCRMQACLIKGFMWFPGIEGKVINMKSGPSGDIKQA